jgi:putative DNA methylase
MSHQVHLLLTPREPLVKILHGIKSVTAHRANHVLERPGPFWQQESFDRFVRDDREFRRIVHYIHHNPVRAGLVATPEVFPWSSATVDGPGAYPTITSNSQYPH